MKVTEFTYIEVQEYIKPFKSHDLIEVECANCSLKTWKDKGKICSAIKNNKSMFCTAACYAKSISTKVKINCGTCNIKVIIPKREVKSVNFCSRSCSAVYFNKTRKKHERSNGSYDLCSCGNKKIERSELCQTCRNKKHLLDIFQSIKDNTYSNKSGNVYRRKYLAKRDGYKCLICNIDSWMGKSLTLRVDHIDGNIDNNIENNLRLVCHNCDSQLPTYCNRNKGNGQTKAKQRLKKYYGNK